MTEITIAQMSALIECEQKADFEKIGLKAEGSALKKALLKILSVFTADIVSLGKNELELKLHSLINAAIKEDCVNFSRVLQTTREKYKVLFDGFIDRAYAKRSEYSSVNSNVEFTYVFSEPFRGKNAVTDRISLLFESDDKVLGVSLHTRKNPYSDRGRKVSTTTKYSPSLLIKEMYLKEAFPKKQVSVEDWYLLPDGKDAALDTDLEHGKRIATYQYDEASIAECFEMLSNEPLGAKRCDNCIFSSLCQSFSRKVREGKKSEEESSAPMQFTDAQKEAIAFDRGICEIIAVAGSGKTRAIVERTARLVENGVDPGRILLFAFTKKAASEMASRIGALVKECAVTVTTEHAFAFDLIQSNAVYFGRNYRVAEVGEREAVIRHVLDGMDLIQDLNYEVDGPYGALKMASRYYTYYAEKGEAAFREHYKKLGEVKLNALCEFSRKVREELLQRGYLEYDDMIPYIVNVWRDHPQFLELVSSRYDYIMVDEFQDTSAEQYEMVKMLTQKIGNLMVVGDDDQSIYGFRGGSPRFFEDLREDFPDVKIIKFGNNFRSSSEICETAAKVVEDIDGRIEKRIEGRGRGGVSPFYYRNSDPRLLVSCIQRLIKTRKPSDVCVLTRNNQEAEEVHNILASAQISSTVPKDYLKDDAVFNVIFDLLKYYDSGDDFSLYRLLSFLGIVNFPPKKQRGETYSFNLMSLGISNAAIDKALGKIEAAISVIDGDGNVGEALSLAGKALGLPQHHPVYTALIDLCVQKDAGSIFGDNSLYSLMCDIVAYQDLQRVGYEPNPGEVQIFTAHDAKGLQFDAVCIWRTEMFGYDTEDRNLMYVASTRAKNLLIYMEGPESEKGPYPGFKAFGPVINALNWH